MMRAAPITHTGLPGSRASSKSGGNFACVSCGASETLVFDSRPREDGRAIRRRRGCASCGARFSTFERAEHYEMPELRRMRRAVRVAHLLLRVLLGRDSSGRPQ